MVGRWMPVPPSALPRPVGRSAPAAGGWPRAGETCACCRAVAGRGSGVLVLEVVRAGTVPLRRAVVVAPGEALTARVLAERVGWACALATEVAQPRSVGPARDGRVEDAAVALHDEVAAGCRGFVRRVLA